MDLQELVNIPIARKLNALTLSQYSLLYKKCTNKRDEEGKETDMKSEFTKLKNFEFITIGMIVASVAVFVYQNSTTKLFGPTAAVYVATAVIMNLFLIYTITRAKSIVSRTFFAMANGLGIAFCLVSLFGVSPLTVKIGVGVAAYLYIYLIVAFASLYLLFSPATTKWLQNEDPIEFD